VGYDVHITRRRDWFEDGPEIPKSEWLAFVTADPEMRLDGYAEARLPDGGVMRTQSEGLSVWTAYSLHRVDHRTAWFDYRRGNITVKNPDPEILRKMWSIAESLGAKVQGDEGEVYDAEGVGVAATMDQPAEPAKKSWWKR
jgi:hypothetical protein